MQMLHQDTKASSSSSNNKVSKHAYDGGGGGGGGGGGEQQQPPQDSNNGSYPIDSSTALQNFLDRIPISLIPLIHHLSGLELKAGDYVKDALRWLYDNNVLCAPITDFADSGQGRSTGDPDDDLPAPAPAARFADRHIGFIDFPSMLLWCLEESEKHKSKEDVSFFSMLQQNPRLAETKLCAVVDHIH
ncbi:hypothetical protein Dimus_002300 [Dionaea muscipula]